MPQSRKLRGPRAHYARVCVSVSLSAGRDNPLTQVRPSLASSSQLTAALLPAYCEKTAFSTLEVLPREEGLELAWDDAADAPDALACARDKRVASLRALCNFVRAG